MINTKSIETYMRKLLGSTVLSMNIEKLGAGVQGVGFLIDIKTKHGPQAYVIKGLYPEGLEHDYPADRAGVFLLDLEEFKNLPKHVRAVDVLAEKKNGTVYSIGGGKEYYLLMEKADGVHYFHDLHDFKSKSNLDTLDMEKIQAMSSYLAKIHAKKKDSRVLHWRKVRDTIGHGECLMGVFDSYPDGVISYEAMAEIEKKCVDWRARLKPKYHRLCQVHGDFHPGNIWFQSSSDFVLLDRSRGPWGDAADDVTALTINYIFFSICQYGKLEGVYYDALNLFYDKYISQSGDDELCEVVAPFYAFRGAVVANPVFYPDVSDKNRKKIFRFINAVLDDRSFSLNKVNDYIGSHD